MAIYGTAAVPTSCLKVHLLIHHLLHHLLSKKVLTLDFLSCFDLLILFCHFLKNLMIYLALSKVMCGLFQGL